jgi:hypothetical protein
VIEAEADRERLSRRRVDMEAWGGVTLTHRMTRMACGADKLVRGYGQLWVAEQRSILESVIPDGRKLLQ